MLVSERLAMYQFLQQAANTTGALLFLRNGSSASVPKTFSDLLATSRAVVEYKYLNRATESNGQQSFSFSRGRSLMPVGGYGAKRTVLSSGVNYQTYAVYPEYTRVANNVGANKAPVTILAQAINAQEVVTSTAPSWSVGEMVEYDYGRTLRFRSLYVALAALTTSFDMFYQDTTTNQWVKIDGLALGPNDGINILTRRIRLVCKSATTSFLYFIGYAERGSEFVNAALTHAVFIPGSLGIPSGSASYLSQVVDDYFGLVLDIGPDLVPSVSQIGQYSMVHVPDLNIKIADNFLEGV